MCRFTLYHGPPIRVGALVTEPRNSLIHQSAHSRERAEPLNGDGFGLAWYPPEPGAHPALFRSITPAWNNSTLRELARVIQSGVVLAHVRAARLIRSVSEVNCHPFTQGPYAFMHNGDVGGFTALRRALLGELSDAAFGAIDGATDTEHAFALLLDRLAPLGQSPTLEQLVDAVRATIARLLELVARYAPGSESHLNFALSDGRCSVVTRFTTRADYAGESLYLHRGRRFVCEAGECRMVAPESDGGAVLVASEPLSTDPGWEAIPRNHLVAIGADRVARVEPLGVARDHS
jgi:predicted glutamine amidotransferase